MLIRIFLTLVLISFSFPAIAEMQQYRNARFGYAVDVPADLKPEPSPINGDGQRWFSEDGKFSLSVWGGYQVVEEFNFENFRQQNKTSDSVSYFADGPDWFVASGVKDSQIFYTKMLHTGECAAPVQITLHIEYPMELKKRFDPTVTLVANSLQKLECPR